MTKQELETELKNCIEDYNTLKIFSENDREKAFVLSSENAAYKKQIAFYESIITGLLGVINE